jgi:feruloyl esterase
MASDRGHEGEGFAPEWMRTWPSKDLESNLQAMVDFADRATHVTAIAGKEIARRFYGRPARHAYFLGCSGGGMEGMGEVQNFPWDFDGVVAGAPALRATRIGAIWNVDVLNEDGRPILDKSDLQVLHHAVIAKCDLNDGIKDGLIGDPRQCDFNPQSLLCPHGQDQGCLTAKQIEAVRKVYAGPRTSAGIQIEPPYVALGSELSWDMFFGPPKDYFEPSVRYLLFQKDPGSDWRVKDFDLDRDYKRLGLASLILDHANPDLRRFKSSGGKLLMYTGWYDVEEGLFNSIDYYETAEKTMGGRKATQEFLRLFVIPGMLHCSGGDGPFSIDFLTYLDDWVDKGHAPRKIVGSHVKKINAPFGLIPPDPEDVEFSRPIFPYPEVAKYSGHGDPRSVSSFIPEMH